MIRKTVLITGSTSGIGFAGAEARAGRVGGSSFTEEVLPDSIPP